MPKKIALMSVKGGVGKTTTSLNLSSALAYFNYNVTIVDANFSNPDIGLHLGLPLRDKTLHSALKEEHHIHDAIRTHHLNLDVVPGDLSYKESLFPKKENLTKILQDLKPESDYIIVDTTPGVNENAKSVLRAVDSVIIVTTADIFSVSSSLKIIKLAKAFNKNVEGIIVNKVRGESSEITLENIEHMLEVPVIGVVIHDDEIRRSHKHKKPYVQMAPTANASVAFKKAAAKILGKKYVLKMEKEKKHSVYKRVLRALGFVK